ncbi:MAG TPA: MBOAT family O-acyltransferase [Terriglobales bacterium]|nr:MBOAT family O-acyltransferase [Terriglobales bacterium]
MVRRWLYLLSSYCFYTVIGGWAVCFLLLSTIGNFGLGKLLKARLTAATLWFGVIVNVLFLAFFKYLPGVMPTSSGLAGEISRVAMPLGISFWTFQAMSYLFDLYREEELNPTLGEFALYMAFAPTVLSGPICRLGEMLPQFREAKPASWFRVRGGLQRIWLGVFMMAVARLLGAGLLPESGVDAGFARSGLHFLDVWVLTIGYGMQLYFDFAGYSNAVIGVAQLFGFEVRENFESPYLSKSPSEFWTRWHMSLSFWIRDYLFMPLATRNRALWWRYGSLVFSMVIFGLWHKAAWTFVAWGAFQGVLLVLHRIFQKFVADRGLDDAAERIGFLSIPYTFLAMCLSWVFFRSDNLREAWSMFLTALRPQGGFVLPNSFLLLVTAILVCYFAVEIIANKRERDDSLPFGWIPLEFRFAAYGLVVYFVFLRVIEARGFVYLQF